MIELQDLDKKILAYAMSERSISLSLQTTISVDYMHPDCQLFYKLFMFCFDKFKEVPTMRVMEEQAKEWTEQMAEIYVQIENEQTDPREFPADLEKLNIRYNEQLLLKFGQETYKQNFDGKSFKNLDEANLLAKKLVASIDNVYGNKAFKEGSLSETAIESWEYYKQVRDNPEIARGIHLGFREFDRITNGMHESELLLIGGESGAGKSVLAMQAGVNAWMGSNDIYKDPKDFVDNGTDVLFFSIEMPYQNIRRRIDACIAGINANNLRDGCLTKDEFELYRQSLKFQKAYPKQFHIIDIPRGCTMAQIESKFIEKCHEYNPQLIVIDYITLMTPDAEQGGDWLNLGRLAEQMHEFTRTYGIRVISPVQLKTPQKTASGETPPPDQHRVGRSIMLTQNSNILLIIKTRKGEDLRPDMEIVIGKMRDGEKGGFILHKRFDIMRIFDDVPGWTPEVYDGYGETT